MNDRVDCNDVLAAVARYVDGELDPREGTILARHLGQCSPCMQRAEFRARLREIVRRKCRLQAPDTLTVRIRAIIRSESAAPQ